MRKVRLSIIVPIYNVELYLERCLRSLEDQDIPMNEFEIICINDGSPDNCHEVVVRFQKEYDNVILIDQENQGVSCARNKGIKKAQGDYLLMIDPDDYLECNILGKILRYTEVKDLDLAIFGYRIYDIKGNIEYEFQSIFNDNRIINGIDLFEEIYRGKPIRDPDRSWGILFRASFMEEFKLDYLLDVPYLEDGELMYRIFCLAERASFNNLIILNRTTRHGSATNSMLFHSKKAIDGFIKCAVNLKNYRDNHLINNTQKTFLNQPITKFSILPIASCSTLYSLKFFPYVKKELINNNLNKLKLEVCSKQYANLGKVYNFSINFFLIYYILWQKIINRC